MKSLVSRIGALEFAKRFWVRGGNLYISPISLRLALLTRSPFGLVAFGQHGVKPFSTLARLGGAGYRVAGSCDRKLSRHWERIRVMFGKPLYTTRAYSAFRVLAWKGLSPQSLPQRSYYFFLTYKAGTKSHSRRLNV